MGKPELADAVPGPSGSARLTVGVDIGGSKILAGVVDHDGRVLARVGRPVPADPASAQAVEDALVAIIADLVDRAERATEGTAAVGAVGVGAAGFLDVDQTAVMFSPHLPWRGEPLQSRLEERLGLPVALDNDANAAAWGECRFGAGAGRRHVLCVTVGTGIGGALVVQGALVRGSNGMAGEFGHMQLVPDGRRCACGNSGCWEEYCSGTALERMARDAAGGESPSAAELLEIAGGHIDGLSGPMVTDAARRGNAIAADAMSSVGRWLGVGVSALVAAFDPELVIVGGGLSAAGDLLLDPAREVLRRTLPGRGFRPEPPLVLAQLGPDAGFVGAADLARSALPPPEAAPPTLRPW